MRQITFRELDFDPIFKSRGIDPETITDIEWSRFIDAFLDGTHWAEIAEFAATDMRMDREFDEIIENEGGPPIYA